MIRSKPSSQGPVSLFEPLEGRKLLSVAYGGTPAAVPGTIQAENFDDGSSGDAYYDTTSGNAGKAYRSTNVDIGASNDTGGGYVLGWVKAGEWLKYTVTIAEPGSYRLDARLAASGTGGTFRVEFAGVDKTGTLTVPGTGGWDRWTTLSKDITLDAGTYVMRVVMLKNGSGGHVANFNWFGLTRLGGGAEQPPPAEQAPAAPSGLSASVASSSQINLSWTDNSNNESGFRLERSTDGSSWSQVAALGAGTTSFSASGLTASTTYQFRVHAYNSTGNSAHSNIASATTQAQPQPDGSAYPSGTPWAVPGRIEAENFNMGGQGAGYLDTTTGNSGGAYRTDDVDVGASGDSDGSYALGWVKSGEWLKYTVEVGQSGLYRLDTRLASGGAGGTFRIEFNGIDKTGAITVPNTGNWGSWVTVSQDVTLEAGVYVMRVVMLSNGSTNHVGNFNWFELTPTTAVTDAPAAPSALSASAASSSQINLAWADNSTIESGFRVERSTNGSTWTQIANLGANVTGYSATGLSANTTYYFRVHAYNNVGASAWTNTASAKTQTAVTTGERPGAHNTGPTNSSILVATPGWTVTQNGSVIENVQVTGTLTINADNVTLRNFRIDANGNPYGIRVADGRSGVVIEDGEIHNMASAAILGGGFTARQLNLHHSGGDALKPTTNVLIEGCWMHHLGTAEGAHADGIQITGGSANGNASGFIIRGNYFDMPIDQAGYRSNSAIIMKTDFGPINDVVIDRNWLNGGNYTIYSRNGGHGNPTNIRVINNRFGRDFRYGLFSVDGSIEISGNVWDDTNGTAP